jgi:KDO2-lipid IV(A) lauroyltransferase
MILTLVRGLLRLSACLPLPAVHAVGVLLGYLLWLIPNSTRRIITINLTLCLPDWTATARRRLLRKNLVETGKLLLELGPLWHWKMEYLSNFISKDEDHEALSAALAQGRGAILITPHLGSWELAGLYYSSRYPMTILYRPSRLGLDPLICAGRGRFGAHLVSADQRGVRTLLRALKDNTLLGVLPDQDPGRDRGVFAPFFGLSANTMTLVARLARRTGAPVFLTYAERLSWGRGFKIYLQHLPSLTADKTLETAITVMNAAIERAVRPLPAQYLWSYKRFKTRPAGVPKVY